MGLPRNIAAAAWHARCIDFVPTPGGEVVIRYLVGFAFVLALVTSPLSVSAQDAEEATTAEPNAEKLSGSSEQAAGTEVPDIDTLGQRAMEHHEIQAWRDAGRGSELGQMELRVKRAKIGYGVSAGVLGVGVLTMLVAGAAGLATLDSLSGPPTSGDRYTRNDRALIAGAVLLGSGLAGAITAGGIMAHRQRELRRLRYGTPRRARKRAEPERER